MNNRVGKLLAHLFYALDVCLSPHKDGPFNRLFPCHGDMRVNVDSMVVCYTYTVLHVLNIMCT